MNNQQSANMNVFISLKIQPADAKWALNFEFRLDSRLRKEGI